MSLRELLSSDASIDTIAAFFDDLDHAGRWGQLDSLNRKEQRELYQRALPGAPIDLAHFVPGDRAALQQVVHHGRNSLPLPASQRFFEKRFCRPESREGALFGYNEAPTKGLIGPGYFVAKPTAGNPEWEARGQVVIDYFEVPDGAVVEGWPKVVPNTKGLQFFVYNKTRDFMRRVSQHVSIGAAYKKEKSLDHYFVLCRED